jgi:hypothetical protein
MKWMKVIDNVKNMMNKEFQHWMESKLIEVIKMRTLLIQLVSIVNQVQMKLTKVISMMNREFQHLMELQLMEVMNMEMHMIEFVSIEN